MMLFLRLIGNDNKQNTVLTNSQIVDILQKEFDMDIVYTHELEIEVYLNLLKRFLKDWPQWDEFDFAINTLKDQKNIEKMKDMLQTNYEGLKKYLKQTLEAVEPMLRKVIKEVEENTVKEPVHSQDDVGITVHCTRMQLNQLFYRRPHPDLKHTILNIDAGPSKIRVQHIPLEAILNWPSVRINISLNGLVFKRQINHVLNHLLVNKKLNYAVTPPEPLNTNFQMKAQKVTGVVEKANFLAIINKIRNTKMLSSDNNLLDKGVKLVCDVLKSDLEQAPTYMQSPASYRQNLSKYPFVRHLFAEVKSDKFPVNNYDLQLEEKAVPQVLFHFLRFNSETETKIQWDGSFLKIECVLCDCIFTGMNMFTQLQQHFDFHQGEQEWHCTYCQVVLPMEHLAKCRWQHNCDLLRMLLDRQKSVPVSGF